MCSKCRKPRLNRLGFCFRGYPNPVDCVLEIETAVLDTRPDTGGYRRCKVVSKCALTVKNELPLSGELSRLAETEG